MFKPSKDLEKTEAVNQFVMDVSLPQPNPLMLIANQGNGNHMKTFLNLLSRLPAEERLSALSMKNEEEKNTAPQLS